MGYESISDAEKAIREMVEFWEQNEADYAGDIKSSEIVRLSRKYIKGTSLDIGAGSGALITKLDDAVGIDIAPKHQGVIKGDISSIPFDGLAFDTVFATDLLEHLNPALLNKGMAEVYRVLKLGGYLIVVVPYKEKLEQQIVTCPDCKRRFHRWGHMLSWDAETMEVYMNHYKFTIVKMAALPLGLMAEHWLIRYFWKIFVWFKFIKKSDLFIVARKD